MIDYIDRLLKLWANEKAQRGQSVGGGLGYPSRSSWVEIGRPQDQAIATGRRSAQLTARGTATRSSPAPSYGMGAIASRVDQEVAKLPDHERGIIEEHYSKPWLTVEEKAQDRGISKKNIYKHIHKAHTRLAAALPDTWAVRNF